MRAAGSIFIGVFALLGSSVAAAAPPNIDAAETAVRLGLSAGYGVYNGNIPSQNTHTGPLLGAGLSIGFLTPTQIKTFGWSDLYVNVGYDFSAGLLQYSDRSTGPRNTSSFSQGNDYYNTVIIRLGLGRPISGGAEIIPYAAGGYQNWYRNINGATGYGDYYNAGMMGGGLRLDVAASAMLIFSADAEGFALIGGTTSEPTQNFSGNYGASTEERVSLDADYRLDNAWHAFAGLGFTHYGYSGSRPSSFGAYEPLGTNLEINSSFGFAYGF